MAGSVYRRWASGIALGISLLALVAYLISNSLPTAKSPAKHDSPNLAAAKNLRARPNARAESTKLDSAQLASDAARIRELAAQDGAQAQGELIKALQNFGRHGEGSLALLEDFLSADAQEVRRAAMRGLAMTESAKAIARLKAFLREDLAIEESTEAALAMGHMKSPAVTALLETALGQIKESVLREHLLDAMAARPWSQSGPFIEGFLAQAQAPSSEKQNVLRMLGLEDSINADYLGKYLTSTDEALRLGSYQGLALASDSKLSAPLVEQLSAESDASARLLIYEALGNQLDGDPVALLALASSESDTSAKLRALKAWTDVTGRQELPLEGSPNILASLEQLRQTAMDCPDFTERRVALFALGALRADPIVQNILTSISQTSTSPKIQALAGGLLRSGSHPPPQQPK